MDKGVGKHQKVRPVAAKTEIRVYMFIAKDGAEPKEIAHTEVAFRNPVLVGLAVCSHQADASDTVIFSDVSEEAQAPPSRNAQ